MSLFSLVFASPALAQHRFDSWTTENGLPQNSVNDIVQTRDGYLWLATHGGLVRFDGVRFVVFDRSIDGIGSQRIRALHEDRHGILWAATEDGMLIRHQDGRFTTYAGNDGLPHATAARIDEDDEGSLWVTWRGGEITKFDGQRFVHFRSEHFAPDVAAPPDIRYLDAWWSHDSSRLHALVKGQLQTHVLAEEGPAAEVTGANVDRHGNLWIRTGGGGVVKAAHGRLERYTTREGLPTDHPDGMFYEGRDDDVWFWEHGATPLLYRIRDGKHELMGLPGARSLYVDREGSTWIGTVANGLHRLRDTTVTLHTEREGLSLDWVYSILEDSTGAIWIGTWGGGVNRLAHGRLTSYRSPVTLPSDHVTCIYEDKAGRLWVGTDDGLTQFQDGRFRRYEEESEFLTGHVWAVHEDREGTFWFATDAGLVKSREGRFSRYTTENGLSHDRITTLFEDESGALWIGAFHGLTRLKEGRFTTYTEQDGFAGNQVRAIHEDSDGILWIGTSDGGLYRLAKDRLKRYTRHDGLHDNGVFQILEDDHGYFWMGSNTGISRVSRRELNEFAEGRRRSITSFVLGTKDGLASLEVNGGRHPAGLKRVDGTLWFPTMGGVAVVDPAAFRVSTPPLRVIIEEFHLAGEPVDLAQELRVAPRAAVFEVRYTAPTFIRPDQVRFRYKLVGLDDEWVDAGNRRTASFYRIPPGKYSFVVTAANHEGVWTTEGQSLDILVLPPLWRTWWFMALAVIVSASILVLGHERRVRRLRRDHARQRAFSQELIDSQERERRRIANEMHDSLGQGLSVIKVRAARGRQKITDDEDVRNELGEITVLADKLAAEMKEIAYALRPYQLDKIGLSRTIERTIGRVGEACGVEFVTDIDDLDHLFDEGAEISVYRIVQEAVNNIIRHSRATWAAVAIRKRANAVEIRIEDNGAGFAPEATDADDRARMGFGLMGIRERAENLGGAVEIRSAQGQGTSIVATFRVVEGRHDR